MSDFKFNTIAFILVSRLYDLYIMSYKAEQKKYSVSCNPTDPNFEHSIKKILFNYFCKIDIWYEKAEIDSPPVFENYYYLIFLR